MSRAKRIRRALARHPNAVCSDCGEVMYWWPSVRAYVNEAGTSLCPAKNDRAGGRSREHTIPGYRRQNTSGPSFR